MLFFVSKKLYFDRKKPVRFPFTLHNEETVFLNWTDLLIFLAIEPIFFMT